MIKFETINGTLCRMVEPDPLTEFSHMPCVIRRKQGILTDILTEYSTNPTMSILGELFEVIGYPVEEGSHWWALYQMMQGKKVSHKGPIRNVYWALNQDGNVQYYDIDDLAYIGTIRSKLEFGERKWDNHIWQLYKEPTPEPAKEQFEVGDWVTDGVVVGPVAVINDGKAWVKTKDAQYHLSVEHLRKLKPSEVVLDFGSGIKGWICYHSYKINEKVSKYNIDVFSTTNQRLATLAISALDTETRELVESLLRAQEECSDEEQG